MTGGPGGKGGPTPPDYTGAAMAQANASRQNTIEQTYANRPDVYLPGGASITWDRPEFSSGFMGSGGGMGGASGGSGLAGAIGTQAGGGQYAGMGGGGGYDPSGWGMHVNLGPEQEAAYMAQQRIARDRSILGESLLGNAQQALGADPNYAQNGADARQRAEDALFSRLSSRLDPMWADREQAMNAQLVNQGLAPGSAAYSATQGEFNRGRNDAYQAAMDQSILGGGQEAQRQFGLDYGYRTAPINELNALLSGQQVGMPQAPGFSQAGIGQAPQLLNAANMGYGAELQQYGIGQGQMQGLMSGAASLLPFFL